MREVWTNCEKCGHVHGDLPLERDFSSKQTGTVTHHAHAWMLQPCRPIHLAFFHAAVDERALPHTFHPSLPCTCPAPPAPPCRREYTKTALLLTNWSPVINALSVAFKSSPAPHSYPPCRAPAPHLPSRLAMRNTPPYQTRCPWPSFPPAPQCRWTAPAHPTPGRNSRHAVRAG